MIFEQTWVAYENGLRENAFAARVPGCLQSDYARAHQFADFNYGYNLHQFDAIEDYRWTYETELQYTLNPQERLYFVSNGIDYDYEIYLNNVLIYAHEGMFQKIDQDITDLLKEDKNVLRVEIAAPPKRPGAKPRTRTEADRSVKPPVSYGWDWHPRLIVSGIWDDTYLETRLPDHIHACEATYKLSEDRSVAKVHFELNCAATPTIELRDPDGNLVYCGTNLDFEINQPRLWWCLGQGEQALYTYRVYTDSCEKTGRIGFRTVELVMNEGAWEEPYGFPKTRSNPPITICLNGRRIFARGSNWVNPIVYTGETTKAHYDAVLTLVRDANMNILRCWGGANVDKDAFFDLCDEYGIMIWQEFPLSCNNYMGEHYIQTLEPEAKAIVQRVRTHPCHVLWCGGNELFNAWGGMTDQSLALRLLNKICYEQDRDKPFIMTSPVMGMAHGSYVFYYEEYHKAYHNLNKDVFEVMQGAHHTAYTEFGVASVSSLERLREIIPPEEFDDPKPGTSWEEHHCFNAWGKGDTWMHLDFMEWYFGEKSDLATHIERSNWLQSEGLKAIFEEARKQKPYCSMAINWCLNEPWKCGANTSIIQHPAIPKPAYFAVADGLRPVTPSARIPHFRHMCGENFSAELWMLNDSPNEVNDTVRAWIELDGVTYDLTEWQTGTVPANENLCGPKVSWPIPQTDSDHFTLKLQMSNGCMHQYKLFIAHQPLTDRATALNESRGRKGDF